MAVRAAIVPSSSHPPLQFRRSQLSNVPTRTCPFNLTQTIAAEGREHKVTATVVIPSIIDTAANRAAMPDADFRKWVTPKAIAQTILFLCSDEAKDISGAVIPVYGAS